MPGWGAQLSAGRSRRVRVRPLIGVLSPASTATAAGYMEEAADYGPRAAAASDTGDDRRQFLHSVWACQEVAHLAETVSRPALQTDGRKKLMASFRLCSKCSQQAACYHRNARLVHASCRHAFMRSLDHHAGSMRLQDAVQTVRYFRCHFFLNLKTFRVDIDKSCKF